MLGVSRIPMRDQRTQKLNISSFCGVDRVPSKTLLFGLVPWVISERGGSILLDLYRIRYRTYHCTKGPYAYGFVVNCNKLLGLHEEPISVNTFAAQVRIHRGREAQTNQIIQPAYVLRCSLTG